MKFNGLKYLLIICIATIFFLKVSNAVSYLKYYPTELEYSSVNNDATEKEEKKVETEYYTDHFFTITNLSTFFITEKKVIIPGHFFYPAYFPEVLTPPPSA
ncbi:hypothetical protein G6M24_34235 [Agrobacterium tumefaciens]|nr:hypothetical protein [Agrobacterium tumefaciens]